MAAIMISVYHLMRIYLCSILLLANDSRDVGHNVSSLTAKSHPSHSKTSPEVQERLQSYSFRFVPCPAVPYKDKEGCKDGKSLRVDDPLYLHQTLLGRLFLLPLLVLPSITASTCSPLGITAPLILQETTVVSLGGPVVPDGAAAVHPDGAHARGAAGPLVLV